MVTKFAFISSIGKNKEKYLEWASYCGLLKTEHKFGHFNETSIQSNINQYSLGFWIDLPSEDILAFMLKYDFLKFYNEKV